MEVRKECIKINNIIIIKETGSEIGRERERETMKDKRDNEKQ